MTRRLIGKETKTKDVEHWMVSWGGRTSIDVITFKSKSGFPFEKLLLTK
jgi:hypothetical protein